MVIIQLVAILIVWNIALTLGLIFISGVMVYEQIKVEEFGPMIPLEQLEML